MDWTSGLDYWTLSYWSLRSNVMTGSPVDQRVTKFRAQVLLSKKCSIGMAPSVRMPFTGSSQINLLPSSEVLSHPIVSKEPLTEWSSLDSTEYSFGTMGTSGEERNTRLALVNVLAAYIY